MFLVWQNDLRMCCLPCWFCLTALTGGTYVFGVSSVFIVLRNYTKMRQVFECLRRLLLTGVLVFVPDKTGQAVAYGCIFAFVRYVADHWPVYAPTEIPTYWARFIVFQSFRACGTSGCWVYSIRHQWVWGLQCLHFNPCVHVHDRQCISCFEAIDSLRRRW